MWNTRNEISLVFIKYKIIKQIKTANKGNSILINKGLNTVY